MKLDLAFPCKENLNTMPDSEKGKFCLQCSKEVIDFTEMSKEEVVKVLSKKKSCGIYRPDQLDNVRQPIVRIRPKKNMIKLALASMTIFTLSLFGCKNEPVIGLIKPPKSESKQKGTKKCEKLVGEMPEPKIKEVDTPILKKGEMKLPTPTVGQTVIEEIDSLSPLYGDIIEPLPPEPVVFGTVEILPSFPGGEDAMIEYLKREIRYPKEAVQDKRAGIVYVTFVIDEYGRITDSKVIRGLSKEIDEEALRVVNNMPNWIPGNTAGQTTPVSYTLPIEFSLD